MTSDRSRGNWLRDNAVGVVELIISLVGAGAIASFWEEFRAICVQHPLQAASLALAAFGLGCLAGTYAPTILKGVRERRRRTQRVEWLARCFASMSERRRAIVALALADGSVHLSELDPDAATLCELGILGMAPFGFKLAGTNYSVQSVVVTEIIEHRDEWLGGMTPERARVLLGL